MLSMWKVGAMSHCLTAMQKYAGLQARRGSQTVVKVLTVSRSNNVSIMLTQFTEFAAVGPMALRAALLDSGADLGVERLSLLLQVRLLSGGGGGELWPVLGVPMTAHYLISFVRRSILCN